ncbi:hypothetical protein BJ138DRAFT_1013395 [Hygrophoropsis aurantiaca]|uniref:Uncharacterized protein n=1 Tax=Hygrophoropsis aurantiaca TaxID=72124 RepID=A0ACB8A3X1_9AGAM|nr:hypothetical protein BJ138DRAFT_1013395 [Hygrophoropsis aurantiaca]
MHNLFLNEIPHHCREALGMNAEKKAAPSQDAHDPEKQANEIEKTAKAIQNSSRTSLKQIRLGYIVAFAHYNSISLRPEVKTPHKSDYIEAILARFEQNPGAELQLPPVHPEPVLNLAESLAHAVDEPTILGKEVMEEVWSDMSKTLTPSWMGRAPRNLGSPGHGKLKADQWRTAATVNLVITLIRLWGGPDATENQKAILENFIALVIAVRWSTMRSTSDDHIEIVESYFSYYLTSFVKLFGKALLRPTHHFSQHLPHCIKLFGPAHGWWAFPFERYNGIIQRKNTNNKIVGELELTFAKTFCRGGNLKALLAREAGLPQVLEDLKPIVQQYFHSDFRGTLLSDLLALGAQESRTEEPSMNNAPLTNLPDDLYGQLLSRINADSAPQVFYPHDSYSPYGFSLNPSVQYRDNIRIDGVNFRASSCAKGDSFIIFRACGLDTFKAGRIAKIFLHGRPDINGNLLVEFFLVVEEFRELTAQESAFDPYRQFPLIEARIFHDQTSRAVIRASDVISHCATCPYRNETLPGEYRVVLSLNRVCRLYNFNRESLIYPVSELIAGNYIPACSIQIL